MMNGFVCAIKSEFASLSALSTNDTQAGEIGMRRIVWIMAVAMCAACSSKPVTPDAEGVRVSREQPRSGCSEIGRVTGSTQSVHAKPEEALADLKKDASNRGANYVQVFEYSSMGTAVTGMAYICP
jgi:hypothetical protein